METKYIRLLIVSTLSLFVLNLHAQRVSISTDPLRWVTASANIGVETVLTKHLTFDIEASFNPFDEIYSDIKATHLAISPEIKYWFKRPQYSHYLGANILTSIYDLRFLDYTAKGRMAAIGITYGYGFIISKRISITPNIGVGYGAFDESAGSGLKFYPTLTKLGVSISYIIK